MQMCEKMLQVERDDRGLTGVVDAAERIDDLCCGGLLYTSKYLPR